MGGGDNNSDNGNDAHAWSDDLISKLVPDPSRAPEDMMVIFGIPGKSDKAGYRRLYLTLELNEYVEYNQDDERYRETLESQSNNLSGVLVWIARSAQIVRVRTGDVGMTNTLQ